MWLTFIGLFAVGVLAGAQNALAGGGSFLTLPALMLAGLDARAANIASALALWPGQLAAGWAGRDKAQGMSGLSLPVLCVISLAGGGLGALLLLHTPARIFASLVPYLMLGATLIFAWGSFRRPKAQQGHSLPPAAMAVVQLAIATYGGYFGGGIGILMMAAFTLAGLGVREAGATKNLLNGVLNTTAFAIFATGNGNHWSHAAAVGLGALAGGQLGVRLMAVVNDRALRIGIIAVGLGVSAAMFARL